jgi:hypothetical protein
MSKDGYYGDFGSFAEEYQEYERYMRNTGQEEPNVVPCFKCGDQMYEESEVPEENVCIKHLTPSLNN